MATPTPTPNETAQQIRKVWIDLSELPFVQKRSAAKILMELLNNYYATILGIVEFTSSGAVIVREESAYGSIMIKIFREEEDDNAAIERIAQELSKRFKSVIVVALYTGDETAVAFTIPSKEKFTIEMVRE